MQRFLIPVFAVVSAVNAARAGDKGAEVVIDGFKSTTPAAWTLKDSKVPFRLFTFVVPKHKEDERDGELVVSFTGKGSGGDLKANIERWQGMFQAPKGKSIEDLTKVEKMKVAGVDVTIVDIEGIYKEKFPPFAPMAKVVQRPDYRRINVIFASDNGPFFIYLVGPQRTLAAHKEAFDKWLKNFK